MRGTAVLERGAVVRRERRLEHFTIAWNALEGLVAVVAGAVAGSISLVGFGTDSFIEVTSGSVLLWRMSVDAEVQRRELNASGFRPQHSGNRSGLRLLGRNAPSVQSQAKGGARSGQRRHARGRQTNRVLHVSFRHPAR